MKEPGKTNQHKQDNVERKHNRIQETPEPVSHQIRVSGQEANMVGETPFKPPIKRHVTMLSRVESDEMKAHLVLQLQRTYGNSYVQRLLDSLKVQAELNISSPDDMYEREADRVAEKVVQAMGTDVQRQAEEEELQMQQEIQIQIH